MSLRVVIWPAADADLINHYMFIGLDAPAAAERFLQAVRATADILADMPAIGAQWPSDHPGLQGIRYYPVRDFPNHLLFYRKTADAVEILHVFHGARDIANLFTSEE